MSFETLNAKLAAAGQEHVLRFWDELDDAGREKLAAQIDELDLTQLGELLSGRDKSVDYEALAAAAEPPPAVDVSGKGLNWTAEQAKAEGEQALRDGLIGAVLVAGGQGTRLGFDQPKGMYRIGPVSERTLFQIFADRLLAISEKYGVRIPLYIMTSDATDQETREYFAAHDQLGLPVEDVTIFRQGTMPAVDAETGRLLMSAKDSLALSPDGHGGTVAALQRAGCLADAAQRGIEQLFYFQVDNPLVTLCDPELIGHHRLAASEMTTQVIRKRRAEEKVGNVVSVDSRVQIIEYSDLPDAAARSTGDDGQLRLWAGNIAVHVIDTNFLGRMSESADALPFHRANKKVAFVDSDGQPVTPSQPNATKFERFIFDLLPAARNALVVEVTAPQAFAPVKNADGAQVDTPALAKKALSDLYRSWLQAAGVDVGEGVLVEINPRFALDLDDLAAKIPPKLAITDDRYFDR